MARRIVECALARCVGMQPERLAFEVALAATTGHFIEMRAVIDRIRRAVRDLPLGGSISAAALEALLDQIDRDVAGQAAEGGER